jgi:hypothetical protein
VPPPPLTRALTPVPPDRRDEGTCNNHSPQGQNSGTREAPPMADPRSTYLQGSCFVNILCFSGDTHTCDSDPYEGSSWFFKGQRLIDATRADLMAKGLGQDASQDTNPSWVATPRGGDVSWLIAIGWRCCCHPTSSSGASWIPPTALILRPPQTRSG